MVVDLETTSADSSKCQITQIAACIINPRTLEIDANSYFNSEVRPEDFDDIEEEALKITRKTKEGLANAPPLTEAWGNFREYVKNDSGKNKWSRPVRAGFNILAFDNKILQRMCEKFGDVDKDGKQNLFSDFANIDVMQIIWLLMENNNMLAKFSETGKHDIKFPTVARWLGLSTEGLHDALNDVKQEAKVVVRFLRLFRNLSEKVQFEGSMKNE